MGRRGAAPGERRGGRGKGTPNKVKFESLRIMRAKLSKLEPRAFLALEKALRDKDNAIKLRAAEVLFDRLYGKPTQGITFGELDEETGKTERSSITFKIVKAKHEKD